jgi:hypothetical protein
MESVASTSTLHVSFICRSENVWADKPAQNRQQNNDIMATRKGIGYCFMSEKIQFGFRFQVSSFKFQVSGAILLET